MKSKLLLLLTLFVLAGTFNLTQATTNDGDKKVPIVTTDTRYARGATMAFGRMTVKENGTTVTEHGFCWGTSADITLETAIGHTTEFISNKGEIFWMKDLEPATEYYARAYAKTSEDAVGYGEVIRFYTIPKGEIRLEFRSSNNTDADTRIKAASETAIDWWNALTEIKGFRASVGFVDGVQTADCSYGGWIRVGSNSSYQRCGTIMHEMLHGIGVIPWADTEWARFNLRSSTSNAAGYTTGSGNWLGDRVTEVLQFWDNDASAVLKGDYQHMWPYGINGASEDNGSDALYIGCSLVCQALGEDGLQHTSSLFAEPYWAFPHNEGEKYYIKSESPKNGLYTSYLVETSAHALKWVEMTAEEALVDDAAAWYFTFTPSNQYYQIKNAGSGRYISYSSNRFRLTQLTGATTDSENLHLMKGRVDVEIGLGNNVSTMRGYWIIHPESGWEPAAMTAVANGIVNASTFDIANSATAQRWVILTADEIPVFDNGGFTIIKEEVSNSLAQYKAMLSVPHITTGDDIDATFTAAISKAETDMAAAIDPSAVEAVRTYLRTAAATFLANVEPTDIDQPFDITCMLTNAGMKADLSYGWVPSRTYTQTDGIVHFNDATFNIYQEITGMPKGTYAFRLQAFQRPGETDAVFNDFVNGTDKSSASIYLQTTATNTAIKNIMADRQPSALNEDDALLTDGTYVPTSIEGVKTYFANGLYDNMVVANQKRDSYRVRVGVRATANDAGTWSVYSNVRLLFYGSFTPEAVGIQKNELVNEESNNNWYDLSGRKLKNSKTQNLPNGVYIINGKKIRF